MAGAGIFCSKGTESNNRVWYGVSVFDAYEAFVSTELNTDRGTYDVGECFVYNKGDKLDWNHPNRKGHGLIAEFLQRQQVFSGLASDRSTLHQAGSYVENE